MGYHVFSVSVSYKMTMRSTIMLWSQITDGEITEGNIWASNMALREVEARMILVILNHDILLNGEQSHTSPSPS